MKSTYEKRWGHPRFKKATIHLQNKLVKRQEADERNTKWSNLSFSEKISDLQVRVGYSGKQIKRLFSKWEA